MGGVFICVHCADLHRALGTHISKPKGCSGTYLWGPDEIDQIQKIGNHVAQERYPVRPGAYAHLDSAWSKEKQLQFCRDKYETRLPTIQQTRSSLQVASTPAVALVNASAKTGPMQLLQRQHTSKLNDGVIPNVDSLCNTQRHSSYTTRLAVPATSIRVQHNSGTTLAASHGIARSCPEDFDIDAFFDEQISPTDLAQTVSGQTHSSNIIELLTPCFPNDGCNTVPDVLATDARDACVVKDISGSRTRVVPRTTHLAPNSSTVEVADANSGSNSNNWIALDFDSDDFFDQFLSTSPKFGVKK